MIHAVLKHFRKIKDIRVYDHPDVVLLVVADNLILEIVSHILNRLRHFRDFNRNEPE